MFSQGGVQIDEEKITKIEEASSKIKEGSVIKLGKKKIFKITLEWEFFFKLFKQDCK